jgi:hypothetical protein
MDESTAMPACAERHASDSRQHISRILVLRILTLALASLLTACGSARHLPEGADPAKRDWYGEFYNLKEYSACMAQSRAPGNLACEYLRLTRVEEPEYWPYPDVPQPKLPEPPNPPVYREGMTSKEYFEALCKAEAGEFIYRVVENVEGIYQIRPRKEASWDALMDRYVMEDPYGYTGAEATTPQTLFAYAGSRYRFFERPTGGSLPYVRYEGKFDNHGVHETISRTNQLKSTFGFYWRGIKRPNDRELSIAGGELIVVDLRTNEVLGIRRGFARSGFARARSGIQWETAEVCPRLRRTPEGWDKAPEFTRWFLLKVLRPAK